MYVCMYVCMYVYTHIHKYICTSLNYGVLLNLKDTGCFILRNVYV